MCARRARRRRSCESASASCARRRTRSRCCAGSWSSRSCEKRATANERGRLRLEGASREDLLAQVTAARKGDGDTLRVKALLRRGRALAAQGSQEELRAAKRDLKLGLAIHPKDPDVKKALERVRKAIKERDNIFRAISGGSWF